MERSYNKAEADQTFIHAVFIMVIAPKNLFSV